MSKLIKYAVFVASVGVVIIAGCGKSDVAGGSGAGNPGAVASVAMLATEAETLVTTGSSEKGFQLLDAAGDTFFVTTATVHVSEVKFLTADSSENTTLKGRFTFDLIRGTTNQLVDTVNGIAKQPTDSIILDSAKYVGLWMLINTNSPDTTDIVLSGQIHWLHGGFPQAFRLGIDDMTPTAISQGFSDSIQGGAGFVVNGSGGVHFSVSIPASNWFSGLNPASGDFDTTSDTVSLIAGSPSENNVRSKIGDGYALSSKLEVTRD